MILTPLRALWRRRQLERSCGWSREQLQRHQQDRLAALRRFASRHSPFYQRFHAGHDDRPLTELPILTKAVMMEHFDELVTDRRVRLADVNAYLRGGSTDRLFCDRYVVLATSGSSGRRGVFLFDPDEWLDAIASIMRPMAWSGMTGRRRMAMVGSTKPWHYSGRIGAALSSRLVPSLRIDPGEPLPSIVAQLNAFRPDVLAVYPSLLKQLADAQLAGALRVRLRSIASGAEVLPDDTRRRVQEAWGIRVHDTYGASEYAPIAAECAAGGKHLLEDGAIVEIVDDRGRVVPDGVAGARVLLTVFNRRTQPLIRYELSDMVRPLAGSCPCGRPFALIDSIVGRIEEILYYRHRVTNALVPVFPSVFDDVLGDVPVSGWQVRQRGDRLTIAMTGVADAAICARVAADVAAALDRIAPLVVTIEAVPVDALERGPTGKAPLVIRDATAAAESPAALPAR